MKRLLASLLLAPLSVGAAFASVNVNTAQQSELTRVKGLDKHKAKAIIEHRAKNGPYDSLEDLAQLPGFSPDLLIRAANEIKFTGEPYEAPKAAAKKDEKKK